MYRALVLVAHVLAALTIACEQGEAESAATPAGDVPVRVVSLAPSLTEVVLALGAADTLVGVDRYSAELEGAPPARVLGDLFSPDLEGLIELDPSLVIGVESVAHGRLVAWLRRQGTPVETFRLHSLAEVLGGFDRLGRLLSRHAAGAALAARVRAQLDEIADSVRGRPRPRVALVIQRDPLIVVGAGSFASDLLEFAGGDNIFRDLRDAYPRVSLEALAARHPDIVLETSAPGEEARAAVRRYWAEFSFVGRADSVERGSVVLPGAHLVDGALRLRRLVHPDLDLSQRGLGR